MDVDSSHTSLDLGAIGNCGFSALVDKMGKIVWSCFPRFDGDPIFCSLLNLSHVTPNDLGFWEMRLADFYRSEQKYLKNTAVLETKLFDKFGAQISIVDFIPRFEMNGREFRPNMLIRKVSPISGHPRMKVMLRPTFGYGWGTPEKTRGSNHIRYLLSNATIRLTTNAPISYIIDEVTFLVEEDMYFLLMPDESLQVPIAEMAETWLLKTQKYWWEWTSMLTIPFEWQEEVIRACISVKLCHFEETGAFVAAMTTSIPNAPKKGGNFDYRFCWLRDAFWVTRVFCRLGATTTMESYLRYIANIVTDPEGHLQPLYGISLEKKLYQKTVHRLAGYRGMGPVHLGNSDGESIQNDVYGSLIMAIAQVFFDQRVSMAGDEALFHKLEALGDQAVQVFEQPDHGPQPSRKTTTAFHTYSAVMCWAACDRLGKIAGRLKLEDRRKYWTNHATMMKNQILKNSWNEDIKSFVSQWRTTEIDAFLFLIPEVGFVSAKDPKFLSTLEYLEKKLRKENYIVMHPEDSVAFNAATFWYVNVLVEIGREVEARAVFEHMLKNRGDLGILSETVDLETKELFGNFPHSSTMIGLVDSAIRLSKDWKLAF